MNGEIQVGEKDLLIVEDSRVQAKILHRKLTEAGYNVRTAEDGKIGLEMIRQQRPTLVISDIEMPNMNGYELCSIVKSDPELKSIPFILLSTLSDAHDIIKGLHCGADNYVTKPYRAVIPGIRRVASLLETPIVDEDEAEQTLDVTIGGNRYSVKSGRQQVLNLLVSTFENAVEKNNELIHDESGPERRQGAADPVESRIGEPERTNWRRSTKE